MIRKLVLKTNNGICLFGFIGLLADLSGRISKSIRKGFSFMEILVSLVLIVALTVGAFFVFIEAQQTRKFAQMHNEMDAIRFGILSYEATSLNSTLPPSLEVLASQGLSPDESVDGVAHPSFVSSIKSGSGTYLDPWCQEYVYNATDRSLTCVPKSPYGQPLDPVVEYF